MQRNTAINFILSGIALLGIVVGRPRLTLIGSAITAAISAGSALEYLFHANFGIDELLGVAFITTHSPDHGRMSPTTALCFHWFLQQAPMLAQTKLSSRRSAVLGITGLLVAAVGATCSISVLSGTNDAFALGDLNRVAVHTGIGFMLLGIGIAAVALDMTRLESTEPLWVSIGAGRFCRHVQQSDSWQAFSDKNQSKGGLVNQLDTVRRTIERSPLWRSWFTWLLKAHLQTRSFACRQSETGAGDRRAQAGGRGGARGEPSQEHVPREHEPRNPHAHERHSRHGLAHARQTLDTDQRDCLETAQSSGEGLLTLINDILDFSKIEAGKLELETVTFSLRESLAQTVKTLKRSAQEKGLDLHWQVDPKSPISSSSDPGAPAPDHRKPAGERHQIHRLRRRGALRSKRIQEARCA